MCAKPNQPSSDFLCVEFTQLWDDFTVNLVKFSSRGIFYWLMCRFYSNLGQFSKNLSEIHPKMIERKRPQHNAELKIWLKLNQTRFISDVRKECVLEGSFLDLSKLH